MTDNNNDDITDDSIKSQLYELYIDIKTFLVTTEKEKQYNETQKEISSSSDTNLIIKYLKNCIKILTEEKKTEVSKNENVKNNSENNNEILQLQSYIKKLENDLKFNIKKQFMYKIQKDSLEMKIRGYMEIEEEYEELKEKVKYEGGKFLNNDRKDNEIIILRRENSNLKKEINKIEEKSKDFEKKYKDDQDIINGLKFKISQLNKKNEELKEEINNLKNKNNKNEMINVNKHIKEHYNKTIEKSTLDKININNINNLYGDNSNKKTLHLKRDLTNYHFPINNYNAESTKIDPIKALNTIDSGNKLAISNFNKIYNTKNIIAPLRNKKFKQVKKNKSNSVSKRTQDNEKEPELFIKYISGNRKYESGRSLNKISNMQGIGYKLPIAKNNFNIINIQREERNPYEHSALNILGVNKVI